MDRVGVNRKRPAATYHNRCDETSKRQQKQKARADSVDVDSLFCSEDEDDRQSPSVRAEDAPDNDLMQILQESTRGHPPQPRAPSRQQVQSRQPQSAIPPAAQQVAPPSYKPATPRPSIATSGTTPVSPATPAPTSPPASTKPTEPIEIKDEPDEPRVPDYIAKLPVTDQVKIYIGRHNKLCFVGRTNLAKSPVLTSWITDDDPEGPFIMRPALQKTELADFDAICQYMHSGEYAPLLITNPRGSGEMVLDGIATGDEAEYSQQLVRAGRIHCLSKLYQVQGLDELVYKKITSVDVKKYSLKSLVELAGVVFSDKRPQAAEADGTGNGRSMLEEWIVGQMAHNLQEITKSRHDQFWGVVGKTKKKLLYAKVLEEAAERYRTTGGTLPDAVVELD